MTGLDATGAPVREGVGLSNSRARLRELYRDRATLELAAGPGRGTVVRLTIPRTPLTAPLEELAASA